jgi:hypothetical protein
MLNVAVLAGLGLAILAGCDKEYKLTFVNDTRDHRNVELTVPGDGPEWVGTVDGIGSKTSTRVDINTKDLPMNLTWKAGDLDGTIPLDKHTKTKLWIHISRTKMPPVDEDTEVHIQRKAETHEKVHEGTIVE